MPAVRITLMLCCITALHRLVDATSRGVYTGCDAWTSIGCHDNKWTSGNRLECFDPKKGPMSWAAAPYKTAEYTVRTGDGRAAEDRTTYTPGEGMLIYIRALKYGWQYRGLQMHAVDGQGKTVGKWSFAESGSSLFWTPPQCPNAVMHNSATEKPYRTVFHFQAPQKGTGTITFRVLLKRGPANTGSFHYPAKNLVLSEDVSGSLPTLFVAKSKESCADCCKRNGRDEDPKPKSLTAQAFETEMARVHTCTAPALGSCSASAPQVGANGDCYYKSQTCADWRSTTAGDGGTSICTCAGGGPEEVTDASSSLRPGLVAWLCGAALLPGRGRIATAGLMALWSTLTLPGAAAHNWLFSPGRATMQASTIFPCQARKKSDLVAQLSRNQKFSIKWATGHDRPHYFVVLHGKHEAMLSVSDFEERVEDYIKNAPTKNMAQEADWKRYHGSWVSEQKDYTDASHNIGRMYKRRLPTSDPAYKAIDHARAPIVKSKKGHLYEYTADSIKDDVFVSYKSDKHPWIESVRKFSVLYHLPNDYDSAMFNIPGRSGDGHYIVHWRWSGYYDCVDVDLRTQDVAHVNGKTAGAGSYVYSRIDHCQYVYPEEIVTTCMEATVDVEPCIKAIPGWMKNNRVGINVVPLHNPTTVYKGFKDVVNIPFHNGKCASSSWLRQSGEVSEKPVSWSDWKGKTNVKAGQKCGIMMRTTWNNKQAPFMDGNEDLKRALAICAGRKKCKGVTWKGKSDFPTAGKHEIQLCSTTSTTANSEWHTATPKSLSTVSDSDAGKTTTVSFDTKKWGTVPPAPGFVDQGNPFGDRGNSQKFGWNCDLTKACEWCCGVEDCSKGATWKTTYNSMEGGCSDDNKKQRKWEAEVPNGVYEVTTYHRDKSSPKVSGHYCSVEGAMMGDHPDEKDNPATYKRTVEVRDGRLTLMSSPFSKGCFEVNYIQYRKVRDAGVWNEVWMPSTLSNPWWQMRLSKAMPVGVVAVNNIEFYYEKYNEQAGTSCASWWLFSGSQCYDGRPLGRFTNAWQAAEVGVGSQPCSGDTCSGTVCGKVDWADAHWDQNPFYVDCKGAVGSYVWVRLPGANRRMVVWVDVHRATPDPALQPAGLDTKVCYGVEARPQTATEPEYLISDDPEDPIFYSTCWNREQAITWLTLPDAGASDVSPPRWRFHDQCLDCGVYKANAALSPMQIPHSWAVTPGACLDCDAETKVPALPTSAKFLQSWKGQCYPEGDPCGKDVECTKRLYTNGRVAYHDSWELSRVSHAECLHLVERDPECAGTTYSYLADGSECKCWLKKPCCGRCVVSPWDYEWKTYNREQSATPDPTCKGGIRSPDGKTCCAKHCVDKEGKSVCGAKWRCFNDHVGGGGCCTENILLKCSAAGPPCNME